MLHPMICSVAALTLLVTVCDALAWHPALDPTWRNITKPFPMLDLIGSTASMGNRLVVATEMLSTGSSSSRKWGNYQESTTTAMFYGFMLGATLCGLLPGVLCWIAQRTGRLVEESLEDIDNGLLGVDVHIGHISVNLCQGCVVISGLTICNPPGYKSDYLLKVKKVKAHLCLSKLVCSCFRSIVVERIVFKGLDILYEKGRLRATNIDDVLNFKPPAVEFDDTRGQGVDSAVTLLLGQVSVEDVGVKVFSAATSAHKVPIRSVKQVGVSQELGELHINIVSQTILKNFLQSVKDELVNKHSADATS